MAGSAMPQPFRFPISDVGPTAGHLITTAASLRLGHLLQQHLRKGFLEKLSHHVPGLKDAWCEKAFQFNGFKFLQASNEAFSSTFSACLSYFNGEGGGGGKKAFGNEGMSNSGISRRNSFRGRQWTNILLAVNISVYIAQLATQGRLMLWGAKINSLIDKGQLWRLVTSSFLHANLGHLLVNSFSLNSVGPTVETICGPKRFLAVYAISAIASSASSYRFCKSPAVGASGAIFGLVGSVAVFVMRHRGLSGGGKEDLQQIARVIALNMAIGLLSRGIDNWGHLGGLLGGAAASWLIGPAWEYQSRSRDGHGIFVDRAPISYLMNTKSEPREFK